MNDLSQLKRRFSILEEEREDDSEVSEMEGDLIENLPGDVHLVMDDDMDKTVVESDSTSMAHEIEV